MRQRLAPESNRIADKLWAAMRGNEKWWSVNDISTETGASGRYTRRYVRALKEAGYVEASDEAKRFQSTYYKLIKDTGETAPILRGRDGSLAVYDPNLSDMTGEELEQIRSQLNMTLREFADIIGVRDPRTVRRYETMDHVPPQVAEIARKAHLR
jgi:DNA-binding transcriptional ArsR family regulator